MRQCEKLVASPRSFRQTAKRLAQSGANRLGPASKRQETSEAPSHGKSRGMRKRTVRAIVVFRVRDVHFRAVAVEPVHEDDAVGEAEVEVLGEVPDESARDHVPFGRWKHRRVLIAAAIGLEHIGREGRPVLREVPARGNAETPGVLPLEVDGLRDLVQPEVKRVDAGPVRPRDHRAEVPGPRDVPVAAERDGLREFELRPGGTVDRGELRGVGGGEPLVAGGIGLPAHVHVRLRLVDETDGKVIEDVVLRADLPAEILHVIVTLEALADPLHGNRVLLEIKEQEAKARADGPSVRDPVREVRVHGEGHHRRVDRVKVQIPGIRVFGPKPVLGHHPETEREVPRKRYGEMEVRQEKRTRIHRRRAPVRHIAFHPSARMLRHESERHRDVGEISQRRGVEEVRGRIIRPPDHRPAERIGRRRGLVQAESARKHIARKQRNQCK